MLVLAARRASGTSINSGRDKPKVNVEIVVDSVDTQNQDQIASENEGGPSTSNPLNNFETIRGQLKVKVTKDALVVQSLKLKLCGYFTFGGPFATHFFHAVPLNELNGPDSPYVFHAFDEPRMLEEGSHIFPYEIELNKLEFPASMNKPDASIKYRLVASYQIQEVETTVAETCGSLGGHLDYSSLLAIDRNPAIYFVKGKVGDQRSGWTLVNISPNNAHVNAINPNPNIKTRLTLERLNFVRGENLNFKLSVVNPRGRTISNLSVFLIQKTLTYPKTTAKVKTKTLKKMTMKQLQEDVRAGYACWEDKFEIPLAPSLIMPTFTIFERPEEGARKLMDITYSVKFEVTVEENIVIEGELEVTMGTMRSNSGTEYAQTTNSRRHLDDPGFSRMSTWSLGDSSMMCPPSYSTLSSRRPSLETLPPSYDQAWDNLP